MGGTPWSDEHYRSRASYREATSTPTFAHHAAVKSGNVEEAVHKSLDPKLKAGPTSPFAGNVMRECRDSAEHPESNAVFTGLDVTGSMETVPKIIQKNLCPLMSLLLRKSYLKDPAIMIGGIGDATCDRVPLQLGQFESGIEIENDLTNLYLEGGGGGQVMESYELVLYFLARHTTIDCWEKRQKRGYAFLVGDERAYPVVRRDLVKKHFDDTLEADITIEEIVKEVQVKYDLYFILPRMTTHFNNSIVEQFWRPLLGQQFLKLDDPEGISDLIASIVGVGEGVVTAEAVETDLVDVGTGKTVAASVGRALAPIGKAKGEIASIKGTSLVTP